MEKEKTKHITFRIRESFPLTPLEMKFFLENVTDYLVQTVKGRKNLEVYVQTKSGRKISILFTKMMKNEKL